MKLMQLIHVFLFSISFSILKASCDVKAIRGNYMFNFTLQLTVYIVLWIFNSCHVNIMHLEFILMTICLVKNTGI